MNHLSNELPGRWLIKATNFPMWLSGKRQQPSITYGLIQTNPLVLSDLVEYQSNSGTVKSIKGIDKVHQDGFKWRGNGILKVLSSQWRISGMDGDILVIRFKASALTPAGIDILVRDGVQIPDIQQKIANNLTKFNLNEADFQSLIWL
ncbi:hypothetical protein ACWOFR_00675 [Carnobacterium gallinarum]|uniref:hypothetical protein n=1 Tax=Carnobacterium gallinarum TaxID=2749 RepID=UPI0005566CAD|nr:hypothetical protein [Carnobacterium gallinarum]